MDAQKLFKLVIAGDGGVGKTTLTNKFMTGLFNDSTTMTIGVDFFIKDIEIENMGTTRLQIWDFAGEERFRALMPSYINGANGIVYVYSITHPETLYNVDKWLKVLRMYDPKVPILLVGSKIDLTHLRKVQYTEAIEFAKKRGCVGYVEVSAKSGVNVEQTFEIISKLMWEHLNRSEFAEVKK